MLGLRTYQGGSRGSETAHNDRYHKPGGKTLVTTSLVVTRMTRRQDWVNIKVPRETRDQLRMAKEEFNYSSYADFIQEAIDLRMKQADITPTESFDHIGFRMACLSNRMDATLEDFDEMWPDFRQDIKELQEENSVESPPKG